MPNEISLFFVVSSMVKKSIYANTDIKPNNALLMRQINQSSALTASQELEVGWQEKNQAQFVFGERERKYFNNTSSSFQLINFFCNTSFIRLV